MTHFTKASTIALAALICTAGVALAGGNSLAVTSPGLEGSDFKLSVTLDGASTNQTWVQDNTPVCEETYNWEIELKTPDLLLDADDKVVVVNIRQEAPADSIIRCTLIQAANGNNNALNCLHRREGGNFQFAGRLPYGLNAEPTVRMEVVRDSIAGAGGDGTVRLFKNGVLLFEKNNRDNNGTCIDRFRMGQTANILTPTPPNGDLEFDEVVTTR